MSAATEALPEAVGRGRLYCLTPQVDLAVYYDADTRRYVESGNGHLLELITLEKFASFYGACPSLGFACGGQPIGGVIFDGIQAHIAVLPEHRGCWAFLLRPACDWLFKLKPEIRVQVESNNLRAIRFMERNEWKRLDDSCAHVPGMVTYLMRQQKTKRWLRGR